MYFKARLFRLSPHIDSSQVEEVDLTAAGNDTIKDVIDFLAANEATPILGNVLWLDAQSYEDYYLVLPSFEQPAQTPEFDREEFLLWLQSETVPALMAQMGLRTHSALWHQLEQSLAY